MTTKSLSDLQDEKYTLLTDSQGVTAIVEHIGLTPEDCNLDRITGAIVEVLDGDYGEIWLTTSSAPYSMDAYYNTPDYWKG